MKVYVAGPMTGIPQFNFPAFDAAAADLRARGYDVVSPAELDDPETREVALASPDGAPDSGSSNGETWGDFLARDVKLIADEGIEAIVCLPGWERSRGARLETFVARLCDLRIYRYDDEDPLPPIDLLPLTEAHSPITGATPAQNPKDVDAQKNGKAPLDMLEPVADDAISRALAFGAGKYGVRNYTDTPINARVYVAAIRRHMAAWILGEDVAEDSGLHHLAHVGANVHVALAAMDAGTFVDDRRPYERSA